MAEWLAGIEAYVALGILLALFAAFVREWYPPEVTAIGGAALYIVLGFVPLDQIMGVFSNPAPITIAAMFVISGALVRTGLLDALANAVIGRARSRPVVSIGIFLLATMIASGFVNNTPVVLILIPVVIRLAHSLNLAPTRLLIPLSYAAILGGTCTLIGTSTNILVDGVSREMGLPPFSMFEIAPVGIVVATCGGLMMMVLGRFLLPDRRDASEDLFSLETRFLSEITIQKSWDDLGKPVRDIAAFQRSGLRIRGVRSGRRIVRNGHQAHCLKSGDKLIVIASTSELLTLREIPGLRVGLRHSAERVPEGDTLVAEAIVAPLRRRTGESIANLALGRRFGLRVIGAQRHGHIPGAELSSVRLRAADKLLMEGPAAGFDAISQNGDLVSISRPSGRAFRRGHAPMALLSLFAVVLLAALDVMSIGHLALLAVAVLLIVRCIDNDEAWSSIDASILVLIFAMLTIGAGLQQTGAIEVVVNTLSPTLSIMPPIVTLIVVYLLASLLTELVSNSAVAVVMTPIAIGLAQQMGLDPRSFLVAIMFGASASFASPIGYQTNTLVYGAGDYRFTDFLKVGVPMNLFVGFVALIAISVFFPIRPL